MKHTRLMALAMLALAVFSCKESGSDDPVVPEKYTEGYYTKWPSYSPTIHYNLKENGETYTMPTRDLPYEGSYYKVISDGWWSFFIGNNANPLVKDDEVAAKAMLRQLNEDFDYMTNVMGWPRDMAVQNGYRSAVFLYGSGLSTDDAANTETGGWQSWVEIQGRWWPILLLSYYPVHCFNPSADASDRAYQTHAVTHEGIHAMFSSMPGGKKAAWFNEGANCWLQATMDYERKYGKEYEAGDFGWLAMGSILAPFMPIECYGGWLADGTFGGPEAQGLDNNTREILGGIQYSEVFPTFLGEIIDYYAVPWVWMNCDGYVLEGIAKQIGDEQTKRMIQEYRARLALCDLGKYSNSVKRMYDTYMGNVYKPEGAECENWKATPYAHTEEDKDGWLVPDQSTTPGWTGANIIPIKVTGQSADISFSPDGVNSNTGNMSCQICYRAEDGTAVYGEPFSEGTYKADFSEYKPKGGIVFAVVCNLDYVYSESIRSKHFSYRLRLGEGASAADPDGRWY